MTQNQIVYVNQKPATLSALLVDIKKSITDYMLENHNIKFLDDETERRMYDILLGASIAILTPYLLKIFQ